MTAEMPVWSAVGASRRGATHAAAGAANQDAYSSCTVGNLTAIAVADGHGHSSHFRSGDGARLAVDVALRLAAEANPVVRGPHELDEYLKQHFRLQLPREWRRRAFGHAASVPFSRDEEARLIGSGDNAVLRPYGTTLIALLGTPVAMGIVQIGDGDAVAVFGDGEVVRPLPEDPLLDGIHTTSLSQPNADECVRITVLDLSERHLMLALAATDGFASSQVDGVGWWRQVGDELAAHLRERGSGWIGERLPGWLEEPARAGGDDTTMGLLLNQAYDAAGGKLDTPGVSTMPDSIST